MQPIEEIQEAEAVEPTNLGDVGALGALRIVFDELDRIIANQSKGMSNKHINAERFAVRKLRDRVVEQLRQLDAKRIMPRVPEGGA